MYTITFAGVAGPEADIVKVRLYIENADPIEMGVTPLEPFEINATWDRPGTITVGYSYVDASGNESGKRTQTVILPDAAAPATPSEDLELVRVMWRAT